MTIELENTSAQTYGYDVLGKVFYVFSVLNESSFSLNLQESMAVNATVNKRFVWSESLDVVVCREVLYERPYQHHSGSKESAEYWTSLVSTLTTVYEKEHFVITTKSLCDNFNLLVSKRKQQVCSEEKGSGIEVHAFFL